MLRSRKPVSQTPRESNLAIFHQLKQTAQPTWVTVDNQEVVASELSEHALYHSDGYRRASEYAVSGRVGERVTGAEIYNPL